MPRRPRIILSEIAVHIIQRGNNRSACFWMKTINFNKRGLSPINKNWHDYVSCFPKVEYKNEQLKYIPEDIYPDFRKILSNTPGFEGLKPNKQGFSIKFLPADK